MAAQFDLFSGQPSSAPDRTQRARERQREWAKNNPERVRERRRKWRKNNPDKVREYTARYRAKNPGYNNEISSQYRAKHPDRVSRSLKNSALKSKYGISLAEYEAMHTAQDGKCAICGEGETYASNGRVYRLSVDHCHETGKVRGLLCKRCNAMIGQARDEVRRLEGAIDYLKRTGTAKDE